MKLHLKPAPKATLAAFLIEILDRLCWRYSRSYRRAEMRRRMMREAEQEKWFV